MNQYLIKVGSWLLLLAAFVFSSAPTQAQTAIPPSAKVTPDTSKSGFVWTIFGNGANQNNDDVRPESALAGLLVDADGNPLPNLADPAAQGVAIAPSTAPNPANASIKFEIDSVINVSQIADTANGAFTPDGQMPGVPLTDATDNGLSVEILTYLELPAGVTTMGVNSDDGFVTSAGNIVDAFSRVVVGSFVGGRGATDTIFTFSVAEAGVYPFRTVYEEGGGDANIEWFTVKADGAGGTTKVLVNDTANGGIKAYRARVGSATVDPYIKSVTPDPAPRQFNVVSSSLGIVLSDGDAKTVDDSSIVLQVDGQTVVPIKARQGKLLTLTYTPAGLQVPTDRHTASLTYKDSTGVSRTQAWTFYNLKNIVVPAPKITEDFNSYPEDTQPTGWVATNFTVHCDDGRDITSQNSESYENWVLVDVANAPLIDGGVVNVAPGQTFNGVAVTSISSGNILYAESDSRCGNAEPGDDTPRGQTQFIVTKPFDLSQITSPLLTLSSLYTQNQDSVGVIEYSVDGGLTFLPIAYFLEQPDIIVAADGTVDAVATFTSTTANRDTSGWVENGVPKGSKPGGKGYGDALAAPITAALGAYVAPRINDGQTEGHRIEIFRLPAASKKADVRLRFASMGTDSWWFAVDNIAFYDDPTVAPFVGITIPPSAKVTPDTSKSGFVWTIFGNGANQNNDDVRPESALAGLLVDADGNPLPNLADPAAQGVAIAPSTAPNPANAPISFNVESAINVSQIADTANGTFVPDGQMPGVPLTDATDNGLSVEILTYLELPAGVTTMGVNSDDGFVTSAGNIVDAFSRVVVGSFVGGRGATDTIFTFNVAEAGVYPFRTVYEEGGGDANIEWWTVKADGTTRVLVNDTANGGIKAYRARVGSATVDPYIKSVTPDPAPRQFNVVSSSLGIVLSDGDAKTVDDSSIVLQVDGQTVVPIKARQGKLLTLTYTPAGLQVPTDRHTASLTYKDSTGVSRTQAWTFYNLKNIVVPAPKITEDFNSYPEDTQPTGWVATNFTVHCDDGRDITSQNSESYENWVLVDVANAPLIDGGVVNVAPGQTFNGVAVTSISSGNILYAESDSRCGNAEPGDDTPRGQTQFIVTKPFDLSQITSPLLTLSSLYTQNQDSVGVIEYSVDGGLTFLPIAYFLEQPDIIVAADGTVDAVATFTSTTANRDTSGWVENGVPKGSKPGGKGYGDALAAPITAALGAYVAPRINDGQTEGHRIEIFRLPAASKKADVRLRFASMGTDSWWFAVDNIAFYDDPGVVTPVKPVFTPASLVGGNLVLAWTGTGTLQQADKVEGPWTSAPSQTNPQNVPATSGNKFYRISQ